MPVSRLLTREEFSWTVYIVFNLLLFDGLFEKVAKNLKIKYVASPNGYTVVGNGNWYVPALASLQALGFKIQTLDSSQFPVFSSDKLGSSVEQTPFIDSLISQALSKRKSNRLSTRLSDLFVFWLTWTVTNLYLSQSIVVGRAFLRNPNSVLFLKQRRNRCDSVDIYQSPRNKTPSLPIHCLARKFSKWTASNFLQKFSV